MSVAQARLAVVVPSVNGWSDLSACLSALDRERASCDLEVLVPERCGVEVRTATAMRFPWARVFPVSRATTIPQMRALAFRESTAPVVAVIEDHVIVPAGWAELMATACTGKVRVVGGGVVNAAASTTVDRAAFLCEYSHLLVPLAAGDAEWLTGNNTAYDRTLLGECQDVIDQGRWEDVLHAAMRERGVTLWRRPDIVVGHKKHYTIAEYTSQRFLYARAYAGARVSGGSIAKRLAYGTLAIALPPLLLLRIVRSVWASGAHRTELLRSFPLLLVFVISWGAGESAGAWFGPGNALARVK